MSELIEFAKDQCEIFPEDSTMGMFLREAIKTLEVKSIPLANVKQAREEIDDLDRYFDNDYFSSNRDSMFKCSEVLEILDKLIESEENK